MSLFYERLEYRECTFVSFIFARRSNLWEIRKCFPEARAQRFRTDELLCSLHLRNLSSRAMLLSISRASRESRNSVERRLYRMITAIHS